MEIRQLRTLIAVVETGSFTKAAERLFLSQPTISAHIRVMEEELKTQIFVRSTKTVEITEKGMELYEMARDIVARENKLYEKWRNAGKEIITVGASSIPSGYILPKVVTAFLKKHIKAHFVIEHGDSSEIIEGLENGKYDIGFAGMSSKNEGLVFTPFCKDNLVLITPNSDKFQKYIPNGEIPAEELRKMPFVMREKGSASGKTAARILRELKVEEDRLNVVAKLNDLESIKNFVSAGLGVSIISDMAAAEYVAEGKLLQFSLSKNGSRNFYIAVRKNKVLDEQAQEFVGFVEKYYAKDKRRG